MGEELILATIVVGVGLLAYAQPDAYMRRCGSAPQQDSAQTCFFRD